MKTFVMIAICTIASISLAGDRPFADFKHVIGDESITGTESKDTACQIETKWLTSGDLEVTATSRYKRSKPRTHAVVFSSSKGAEYTINHGANDQSEYSVSQSKSLVASNEENVDLYESFTINQDASGTTHVHLSVMEVNDHSDPSEVFTLYCRPK